MAQAIDEGIVLTADPHLVTLAFAGMQEMVKPGGPNRTMAYDFESIWRVLMTFFDEPFSVILKPIGRCWTTQISSGDSSMVAA